MAGYDRIEEDRAGNRMEDRTGQYRMVEDRIGHDWKGHDMAGEVGT